MNSKKWKKISSSFRDWNSIKEFHAGSMHLISNLSANGIKSIDPEIKDKVGDIKLKRFGDIQNLSLIHI